MPVFEKLFDTTSGYECFRGDNTVGGYQYIVNDVPPALKYFDTALHDVKTMREILDYIEKEEGN